MHRSTALLALLALAAVAAAGCATTVPNRDPVKEVLPTFAGTALDGTPRTFPRDLGGKPTVLIVAFTQRGQFDVDRWLLGLVQLQTPVQLFEVPTVEGAIPGLFADTIDEGMRGGIPSEDWGGVVTVYDEAETLVNFLGNDKDDNGRVMLLDASGKVVWFHDRGYSASQVKALDTAVRAADAPMPAEAAPE